MQQVIMSLKKISPILLLLSHISLSSSEELHQQKQLFDPHGASQSYNGVIGNEQDSYMLAYQASRNQGSRPQSGLSQPSEQVAQHPNLSTPRGERHYAIIAHGEENSGERVPAEQERLLLLNQLKREQSEAIARARAIAQSPPVVLSNDVSVTRHAPANYIKQIQIQQVAPVSTHNQVAEQHYLNIHRQNQIPVQHYVSLQSQSQVSAPQFANLQSQDHVSTPQYANVLSHSQVSAPHYPNLQSQKQASAQYYANLQAQNQVPVQHSIAIPAQHQIQVPQATAVPTHNQILGEHLANVLSQNQLSIQRHYPQSLIRNYAVSATKGNNVEIERPVQYEEDKKVYVSVDGQVPVERYVGVDNHIAGPSRQEVHLQAYSQEPAANLRQAWNAPRHY